MSTWIALVPPLVTIIFAVTTRKIIPALGIGLLTGGFLLTPSAIGGFSTTVDYIVNTATDSKNLEVLLFLYLFSGLIKVVQRSGGIKAFALKAESKIKSKRSTFYALWGLIPFTFIDCGFRVVAAGSILKPLAREQQIAPEKLAFQLNNTASPLVELVPIATTFVGFNVGIIQQGLSKMQSTGQSAYSILLHAIPLEFFSLTVLIITFLTIYSSKKPADISPKVAKDKKEGNEMNMSMDQDEKPEIVPRVINLILPLLSVILLSIFLFWYFGNREGKGKGIFAFIAASDPNKSMLVALFISIIINFGLYRLQGYKVKKMINALLKGGNEMMQTLVILVIAWSLASITHKLGLGQFIERYISFSIHGYVLPAFLFILSAVLTYFIGASWGASSLIMPFALPLAATAGISIPLCVAAVLSGTTFGDVTSPIAGMTNMAANITAADHGKYIKYATKYNLIAAGITVVLYAVAGLISK